jgi:hypothetical protein
MSASDGMQTVDFLSILPVSLNGHLRAGTVEICSTSGDVRTKTCQYLEEETNWPKANHDGSLLDRPHSHFSSSDGYPPHWSVDTTGTTSTKKYSSDGSYLTFCRMCGPNRRYLGMIDIC